MPEDNKSEKATARQKQRARTRGQVARSRDLVSALTVLTVTTTLVFASRIWIGQWRDFLVRVLDAGSHPGYGLGSAVFSWTAMAVARGVAPILVLGLAISLLSASVQGGSSGRGSIGQGIATASFSGSP